MAEALGDGTELPQEVGADLERVLSQVLGLYCLQDCQAGRGGDRVSSERVEVTGSFPEGLEQIRFHRDPGDGIAVAHRLAHARVSLIYAIETELTSEGAVPEDVEVAFLGSAACRRG